MNRLPTRREMLAATLIATPFLPAKAAQSLQAIKFASVNAVSDAGIFLADDLGFFKDAGIDCDSNIIANAPGLITAVITGEVDVAGVAITPGLFAASQRGIGLRIVGDKQSIRPGFSNTRLVIRAGEFHGDKHAAIAGLRGKALGVTSYSSTAFYLMAKTLAQNNIKLDTVRTVEMSYPNIVLALSNNAIDGGMLLEPYLSQAIQSGVAAELSDCVDAAPPDNPSIVAIVYSERFAAKQELAERWMIAYMRGVRAYNDAYVKNIEKEKTIDSIARHTHIDRGLITRSFPVGLDPNQKIDLAALQEFQNFFVEIGLLRKPSDIARLIDTSFASNAVRVLGPYSWQ